MSKTGECRKVEWKTCSKCWWVVAAFTVPGALRLLGPVINPYVDITSFS